MKKSKHNQIEMLRFLFAVLIMVFHAHLFNGTGHPIKLGHVFVEFFFFLSGYFTYDHVVRKCKEDSSFYKKQKYAFTYTLAKFKRFMPYMLICAGAFYIVMFIPTLLKGNLTEIKTSISSFGGAPFAVLLLQVTGICTNIDFNAWWYLSAMIFVLPLVVLVFTKQKISGGIAWIQYFVPLLIYGWFAVNYADVNWKIMFGPIRTGLPRAFAGLCMGGNIYLISEWLAEFKFDKIQKMLLTVAELAMYVMAILIAWKYADIDNSVFLIIFMLAVGLSITMSKSSYSVKLDCNVFGFLGRLSTPLYICHYSVGKVIKSYAADRISLSEKYLIYYGVSVLFACFLLVVVEKWENRKRCRS